MTDKREDILVRLLAIAGAVEVVVTAARNQQKFSEKALPAIAILDADEAADDNDPFNRDDREPRRVQMTPEIHLILQDEIANAGSAVNALRLATIKAIFADDELRAILGANGWRRYDGCVSDFAAGRELQARLKLAVTFAYILEPAKL